MDLTQEQKQDIAQWTKEGVGLSEIQKRLLAQHGISITYMDLRLLMLDLSLSVKDKNNPPAKTPPPQQPPAEPDLADEFEPDFPEPAPGGAGDVSVTLDRVVRAGSVASGSVTFSDGVSATWMLDQMGRLGLAGTREGYKPSQRDLMKFQEALRRRLESRGY